MKDKRVHRLVSAALAAALMQGVAGSAERARFEALSSLPFAENRPTQDTARTLRDDLLFQLATQASQAVDVDHGQADQRRQRPIRLRRIGARRSAGSLERAQVWKAILFDTKVPTTSKLFSLASPSGRGWPKAW